MTHLQRAQQSIRLWEAFRYACYAPQRLRNPCVLLLAVAAFRLLPPRMTFELGCCISAGPLLVSLSWLVYALSLKLALRQQRCLDGSRTVYISLMAVDAVVRGKAFTMGTYAAAFCLAWPTLQAAVCALGRR